MSNRWVRDTKIVLEPPNMVGREKLDLRQQHNARTTKVRVRRLVAAVLGLLLAVPMTMGLAGSASAASGYGLDNTDPYTTGCNRNAWPIATRWVAGGRLDVFYSGSCQTNWVQWSGPTTCTNKRIQRANVAWTGWTGWEKDYANWSYGRQVYAPGATKVNIEYAVTPSWYPTCGGGAWDYAHDTGGHGYITVS